MDLLLAAKRGDELKVLSLIQSSDVNYENVTFETLEPDVKKKSIYCAECYQRLKRRSSATAGNGYWCDWPHHKGSMAVADATADICTCDTSQDDECNWIVCLSCFLISTYDIKSPNQMYCFQEGFTPLLVAANRGHAGCVKILTDHGADVNEADPNGMTPLLAAAVGGKADVVKLLLERGAEINHAEKNGRTALFLAADIGDAGIVELLLNADADIFLADTTGSTVLHAAASTGHVGIMQALLDRGLSAAATDERLNTPLHLLPVTSSAAAAVRLLLERGAVVDANDNEGYTPIACAMMRNSPAVVTALLKAGANTIYMNGRRSCLYASSFFSAPKVTEALLEGGIVLCNHEPSPLIECAQRNLPMTAEVMLKYGVKGAGRTLVLASRKGRHTVVKVILEHWDPDNSDMAESYMSESVEKAAQHGHTACVRLLLPHCTSPALLTNLEHIRRIATSNKIKSLIQAHLSGDDLGVDAEDEEVVCSNREHLQHALKKGTKKWGRSKIMIVGDGRAGKTALANSIMGEEFAHTESTIGINQMTCDVKYAEVGKEGGQWDEYTKPDKELEAALAKIVAARRGKQGDGGDDQDAAAERLAAASGPIGNSATAPKQASVAAVTGAMGNVSLNGKVSIDRSAEEDVKGASDAMVIDDALVMKYLANLNDNTKFIISLFDYGGQTVFNVIHHLFLTRYGVYTLVFNMEQLVSADAAVRENCLSTISFWLNSIVVHTWNTETESMAPIVIVGTHKDIVNQQADHERISQILHDKFCSSVAWPWIQENEETEEEGGLSLCFFPVDNRKSRKDKSVIRMMKLIEDVIDKSDYVHVERPLTWLQTMDKLTASGKAYLPLVEVEAIAQECEVPRDAVPSLLGFLNEMGIIMWHDDIALRDVVILDAVAYFVTPVTTIICKHLSTAMDATRHVVDVHKKCRKQYYDAWMKMVHHGIVNTNIIDTLLQDCGQHVPIVLHLMVKFGLVVPLQIAQQLHGKHHGHSHSGGSSDGSPSKSGRSSVEFLVPALLPLSAEAPDKSVVDWSEEYANTCLFVFSCSARLLECSFLTFTDSTNLGFLPRGLFERLICKAVEWCRETSAVQSLQSQPLYQDAAVLVFGNQKFRMRAYHDRNCIEVNFAKGNPLAVHQRLCDQLQQILDECMRSLKFFTVVPYPCAQQVDGKAEDPATTSKHLIQLEHMRNVSKGHTGLHAPGGEKLLNKEGILESYGSWLVDDALRSEYDVFISYRWGTLDSRFTERLRDRFSIYNVGSDNRAVAVFLDSKRLRDGRNFVDDFACALVNSSIVVPVVSADALERMMAHDPYQRDHALMEWIMALECFHSPNSRVARVLPVLFGSRDSKSDAISNLFAQRLIEELPEIHPKESMKTAVQLLQANGVEPRRGVGNCTVRSILLELKAILGYCAWTAEDPSFVVAESGERVINSLQEVLSEGPKKRTAAAASLKGPLADTGASGDRPYTPSRDDMSPRLRELMTTSPLPTVHPAAVAVAAAAVAVAAAATGSASKRTIKEVVEEIRLQLGLPAEAKMGQVLQEALDFLGDDALAEECKTLAALPKAERILRALLG